MKVVVTGAAGLVGQNLIPRLKARAYQITAIDKHPSNTATLRRLHPDIMVIEADLAECGGWYGSLADADAVVLCHAQIGGLDEKEFNRNNVVATQNLLDALAINPNCYVAHISSSVVNSAAKDWYTESKKAQERLITESTYGWIVLRPTLMFGWFDRKHLGWLARFMKKVPIFPVPGHGRYIRQPLYAGDFAEIIVSCLESRRCGEQFNISGLERIDFIDLMKEVRRASGARASILRVPYRLFWLLLRGYGLFSRNPPFTVHQLKALVTPDIFEIIDWPKIFGVRPTPLREALVETFQHPRYATVRLDF
jgi:nucleoside-diphosphate-sugar epimerase